MNAAYLAGFLDGEGHISIRLRTRLRKGKPCKPIYEIQVQIGQKIIEPLEAIQALYGGHIRLRAPGKRNEAWILTWGNNPDVLRILMTVKPYIIGKREQTLQALAILKTLPKYVPIP